MRTTSQPWDAANESSFESCEPYDPLLCPWSSPQSQGSRRVPPWRRNGMQKRRREDHGPWSMCLAIHARLHWAALTARPKEDLDQASDSHKLDGMTASAQAHSRRLAGSLLYNQTLTSSIRVRSVNDLRRTRSPWIQLHLTIFRRRECFSIHHEQSTSTRTSFIQPVSIWETLLHLNSVVRLWLLLLQPQLLEVHERGIVDRTHVPSIGTFLSAKGL